MDATIAIRAARHAALSDPIRLAVVDELATSDRSPVELRNMFGIESNLLAHHLDVLDSVGMITRSKSSGDGRRRYVHLKRERLHGLTPGGQRAAGRALFVCTHNSARSQIAAVLWRSLTGAAADSAGTHPAENVHRGAIAAVRRAGLDLTGAIPRTFHNNGKLPRLVITVCDQAHEELASEPSWLHWSVPDPVAVGSKAAFDATLTELRERITTLVKE